MSPTCLYFSQKHSKSSQLAIVQRCTLPLSVMNSICAKYSFIPEVCTTLEKSKFFHLNQSCNLFFGGKNSFILKGFCLQCEVLMKTLSGSQDPSPSSPKPRNCSWYTEVLSCSFICVHMDRSAGLIALCQSFCHILDLLPRTRACQYEKSRW